MGILVAVSMAFGARQSSVTVTPPIVTYAVQSLVNSPAPDFTLQTLNGEAIQLSSLRGKWVFLSFWATWYPPCRQEMPTFQQFIDGKFGDTSNAGKLV